MKCITIVLLTCSLCIPGLLLAETAEVIPWSLDPDEGTQAPGGETTETDKKTKEKTDKEKEPEEEFNYDIKINKDYPNSYFYPGPERRNEPSFGIPGK